MGKGGKKGGEQHDRIAGDDGEIEVLCPCCHAKLLVDAATGVILQEERKKAPSKSFEGILEEDRARREASDELFGKALASERNQQDILQRKFEKALKRAAKEPDKKPRNPFDMD